MRADLSVLATVRIVVSYCLPDGELPHVVYRVNDFLYNFSTDFTIVDAYRCTSSLGFMQYVAARDEQQEMNPFYRRWLFNTATEMAASRGDLEALRWLVKNCPPEDFGTKVMAAVAANGHLWLLKWLFVHTHQVKSYWGNTEMCGALMNGHVEVVKWLRIYAVPKKEYATEVVDVAAGAGYLDIVKWLHGEYKMSLHKALSIAMSKCHWETSEWILEKGELPFAWVDWDQPAKHGALAFLKFLHAHSIGSPGYLTLQVAACNGQLDVVKWLHEHLGATLAPDAMRKAAQNGHLAVVEWLQQNGCEGCDDATQTIAADQGVVKWV